MENEIIKPTMVFMSPIATRSGYGDHSLDVGKSLLRYNKYDVKFISTPWGGCPMDALHIDEHADIISRILQKPLTKVPEVLMQMTIPNEFQKSARYNIGFTAGIETTLCRGEWLEGLNRMNVVFVPSNHAKDVFLNTKMTKKLPNGQTIPTQCQVPIEVVFEGADTSVFNRTNDIPNTIKTTLNSIEEDFCFLFVGHWIQGDLGHDRKDVGMLIKTFIDVFKNQKKKPALILKTSSATLSVLDRDTILKKIDDIKKTCSGDLPNIYLLHGELTREEMNGLYNHPKVKAHVSFTHGEGFCVKEHTKVITKNGLKQIIDIEIDEEVLTHDGTYKKVIDCLQRHYVGEMIKIETYNGCNSEDIELTPNHNVYFYDKKSESFDWKPANEIKKNDLLVFPIANDKLNNINEIEIINYLTSKNIKLNNDIIEYIHCDKTKRIHKISNKIKLNSDFGKIIGYYLSEGSLSGNSGIVFSFNKDEEDTCVAELINCFKTVFGIETYELIKSSDKNVIQLKIWSTILNNFFLNFCGKLANGKFINDVIFNSNDDFKKSIITSLLIGDGEIKSGKGIGLSLVNDDLIRSIRLILMEFGVLSNHDLTKKEILNERKNLKYKFNYDVSRIRINSEQYYNIVYSWINKFHSFFNFKINKNDIPNKVFYSRSFMNTDKTFAFIKVKNVETTIHEGTVYNLSVDGNESYCLENFMVHNCRPLLEASLSGKPVIAPNWSGHTDFLNTEYAILLEGEIKQVHQSTVNDWVIKESSWFYVNYSKAAQKMEDVYKNYSKYEKLGKELAKENSEKYSLQAMDIKLHELLDKYIPEFEREVKVNLPKLKKINKTEDVNPEIKLPKLKKKT